ncbi:stage V sporulation protein T [Oceanobacillus iheyensis]|uniref:Stage V sporulation protein T (Transcriptional regulator) n=1 Tax=Oceanobacillus iheyensis (strain DSM 14371 / CIP 107618 / JCM 11309 / KCTC 3954 / HTE831) TaxID=221109 RepID=Q8CXP7_OCEIH|nr:stage V sporulation protein T [Oceanobacillus iheyensis]BAC12020.1 stage V sporulation protein T (transcriptional regulator) [Oceanobacillus iheyensis HTE831]
MKATGIVRRIDDLGRVVVPKEIRRTLRIREGDPLEIFVDREGEVILKKYSPINELGHFAKEYAEALFQSLQTPVMITDRDDVIAVAGESKKEYLNKPISNAIADTIEGRSQVFEVDTKSMEIIDGQEQQLQSYCIHPVIANGDPIGCVLIFSKEEKLSKIEQKAAETASTFLAKQME